MNKFFGEIKDYIYFLLVESNEAIRLEYQGAINNNPEGHRSHRIRSWLRLLKLNIKYRVFRRETGFLSVAQPSIQQEKKPADQQSKQTANQQNMLPAGQQSRKTADQHNNQPVSQQHKQTANQRSKPPEEPAGAPAPTRKNPAVYPGVESSAIFRPKAEHYMKELMEYEIVSFDLFDTLIFRPFADPEDRFLLLSEKHGVDNFQFVRVQAEAEARERQLEKTGNSNISIFDIYERVEAYTGIEASYGARVELELELSLCYPNPYLKRVFDMLMENGQRMYLLCDTVLSKSMVERLLNKNGYVGFEQIMVSSEYKRLKKKASIYEMIEIEKRPRYILHIDDVFRSVEKARKAKWAAYHYKNVNIIGLCHRAPNMAPLVGSTYAGVVNAYIHNGNCRNPVTYEFGFVYGGLLVLGFCQWIHEQLALTGIDKILFLLPKGDIVRQVYQKLYPDDCTDAFYWSKNISAKIRFRTNRYAFIKRYIYDSSKLQSKTIVQCLQELQALPLIRKLDLYGLKPDTKLNGPNSLKTKAFAECVLENADDLADAFSIELRQAENYLTNMIGGLSKVAFVCMESDGAHISAIQQLLNSGGSNYCEISGLYLEDIAAPRPGNLLYWMDDSYYINHPPYRGYIPRRIFEPNDSMMKLLFASATACMSSFYNVSEPGTGFLFWEPAVENYPAVQTIQKGIFDFVLEYLHRTADQGLSVHISGSDAAALISHLKASPNYITKYFKGFLAADKSEK